MSEEMNNNQTPGRAGHASSGSKKAKRPMTAEERARLQRQKARIAEKNRRMFIAAIAVVLVLVACLTISLIANDRSKPSKSENNAGQAAQAVQTPVTETPAATATTAAQPKASTASTEKASEMASEAATESSLPKNQITKVDGKDVYVDHEGNIAKNTIVSFDGYLYSADAEGALTPASGWQEADGKKYYAESDGQLHPGAYITIDGTEYHMDMSGAVIDGTPTIDQYLGCTDLLGWMLDHQSDYYYQTNFNPMTDYPDDPEMLIRPYGEYGDESHMNCAGFIAHMLKSAGGDLSKISDMGGRGGYTNADNYMKLCTSGLIKYETYDSIEDLLASGHAQKGDILYLQPNWNPGEDCHIGLFWGDTSSEDKFWQQNWDIKNAVTNIRMDDPIVKIYLIPISR